MNAYELADGIESCTTDPLHKEAATMLRQQQAEIEVLKDQLDGCTCQGGHSEAWLKAKGRLK